MATDKKINYEMQGKVRNYLGKQKMVKAPLHWRSGPKHPPTELAYITKKEKDLLIKKDLHKTLKGGANRGPSNITSLNGWGSRDAAQNRAGADISAAMDASPSDAGWSGGPGGSSAVASQTIDPAQLQLMHERKGGSTVLPESTFGRTYRGQGQSKGWGGNIMRGIATMFGGIPGRIGSMLSHINPQKLRGWNEEEGRYNTQQEYEDARAGRINQKNIDRILNRSDEFPVTGYTQNRLKDLGYTGEMPNIGSTATTREANKKGLFTDTIPAATGYSYNKGATVPTNDINYKDVLWDSSLIGNTNTNQNVNKFTNNVAPFTSYADQTKNSLPIPRVYAGENEFVNFNQGGRAGYRNGEFVDENINVEGPGFDVNENVEMAETSAFDLRIEELMGKGLSYDDAYDIAAHEFQDLFAEGPEDSFNQEGIASLV
jgi:hypothetical protein